MAEEQKPVEVPAAEAAPETTTEAAPVEAAAAEPAAAPATETPETVEPAAAEAAAPAEEAPKEEVKPVEEGVLEAKGSSFPKNFLYSKKYFWFGSDAVEPKDLSHYLKAEKVSEVAHHVAAWASETGKGLLFYSEKPGDKSVPHGAIHLADASEPTTEGPNKFTLSSKGHKHTFKAGSTTERDNWVAQLKVKIAEAKELAATVTESETYKKTLETFKPAKKEEKKVEEPAKEEPAKEAAAEEAKPEEPVAAPKEEEKKEEPKRRSASRKRASIFGSFMGGKKEEKKEEKPAEAAAETPAEPAATSEAPAEPAAPEAAPAEPEAAPAEAAEAPAETKAPETKPAPSKRTSLFGTLSFGKKKQETEAAPATPAKDAPAEAAPVAETAPVIPAVETTEPLSTDVSSPATVPTETVEAPVTNGETKKEVKSDKRKSSLPFAFGKKEKATSDEEGEKPKSPSAFSKLRATIKGKPKEKAPAKTEEKPAEGEAAKEAEPAAAEPAAPAEAEAAAPATEEAAPVSEPPAATPQVAATA